MAVAKIVSINISEKKGMVKTPVAEATLIEQFGVEGDAHGGDWHRQVSLLSISSIEKMQSVCNITLQPGIFAENITVEGMDVYLLPVGARLRLGECELEVTQIGKECHAKCEIFKMVGSCVMPKEGIFASVIRGGKIKTGDEIELIK